MLPGDAGGLVQGVPAPLHLSFYGLVEAAAADRAASQRAANLKQPAAHVAQRIVHVVVASLLVWFIAFLAVALHFEALDQLAALRVNPQAAIC